MDKPFEYITFSKLRDQILPLIESGKMILLYTFPFCGQEYRIQSLVNFLPSAIRKSTSIIPPLPSPTLDEWEMSVLRSLQKNSLLIIPHAEYLLRKDTQFWLSKIIEAQEQSQASILWLAEIMPFQLKEIQINTLTKLLAHQFWLPQFSLDETSEFIAYLENKFGTKSTISGKAIFEETGGHSWLIKEIMRQQTYSNKKVLRDIIQSDSYRAKAHLLFQSLPGELKAALINASKNVTHQDQAIIQEATALGILRESGKLPEYLKRLQSQHQANLLQTKESNIFLNDVNVTSLFSLPEQKCVKLLLQKKNSVTTRNELAKALWDSDTEYTDWALDRAMFRLRKKLTDLNLPPKYLTTLRKVGYRILG